MMPLIKSMLYGLILLGLPLLDAQASDMASANYRISWDVTDGGGGLMTSTNYVIDDSVGQPSAIGGSQSNNYRLQAGFHAPPDSDADWVRDFMDNCTFDPNTSQLDSNSDGYGNLCDADLDNSGFINFADLKIMKNVFFAVPGSPNWNPDADFTGDNVINFSDLFIMQMLFFGPPGPSGIAP